MLAALIWLLALTPRQAAYVVAETPEEYRTLVAIGRRESRLRRIGIHDRDGWTGAVAWQRAVGRGLLDPRCPLHRRGDPRQWSTRGSWGQIAAYAVPYLPGCWPAWAIDIPIVGAWTARERLRVARGPSATRGLRRWAAVD